MTKREMYAQIKEMALATQNEEIVAFCDKEVELLDRKKASSKETAKQKENKVFMELILGCLELADKPLAIADIVANVPELKELSNQRVSALLTKLKGENKVVRCDGKKATFIIA